jgi:hypothetical protein
MDVGEEKEIVGKVEGDSDRWPSGIQHSIVDQRSKSSFFLGIVDIYQVSHKSCLESDSGNSKNEAKK